MFVVHLVLDDYNLEQSHRDLPVRTWHQVFVLYVLLLLARLGVSAIKYESSMVASRDLIGISAPSHSMVAVLYLMSIFKHL